MKEFFAYVLGLMLTSAKRQDNSTYMLKKLRKLRLEYFESYSSFSYCTHSSVYRVSWPSGRVIDCFILFCLDTQLLGQDSSALVRVQLFSSVRSN